MRVWLALFMLLASAFALAESGGDSQAADQTPEQVMDGLFDKAYQHAVKAVEESGGFYPFALVRDSNGRVHFLSYGGAPEERPSVAEYAYELLWQLRNLSASNSTIAAAVMVKPTVGQDADGERVPGIHFIVDHRGEKARTVLLPIIENEGKYGLGDVMVLNTDDFLIMNPPDAELDREDGAQQ